MLLISDVVMPEMDGPTMVREARESRPDLPVLFMRSIASVLRFDEANEKHIIVSD